MSPSMRREAAETQQAILMRLADTARVDGSSSVALRIPASACFVRRTELPAAAASDFQRLLSLDFERTMPFKLADVHIAHFAEKTPAAPGKVWVRQLIVKRPALDALRAEIEKLGLKVDAIESWDSDGATVLPVNFLDRENVAKTTSPARSRLTWLGAALATILSASALYLLIDRYETALQDLQVQTERQKAKAKLSRDALSKSQTAYAEISNFYRLKSETVTKLAVIEELTRLLPDSAWVTDLKVDGATVDISGFAKSAAALVPILERSAMFVDATPTAPLTFDPREDKDRFSIRVHIRKTSTAPSATKAEPKQ